MTRANPRRRASSFATLGVLIAGVLVTTGCASISNPTASTSDTTVVGGGAILETNSLEIDGERRTYLLRSPVRTDEAAPLPLLLVVHGAGGNAKRAEDATGLTALSDANGFIVAYPNGTQAMNTPGELAWNAGACCGKPVTDDIDDVAFITAAIDDIEKQHPVDRSRIFIAGFSNGGMLAYRLACEKPGLFAGVAVVAGALNVSDCSGAAATSMLLIHGTGDLTVPHSGGATNARTAARFGQWENASLGESIAHWAAVDGCDDAPSIAKSGAITRASYTECSTEARIEVVTISGGGHVWPTARKGGIDASALVTEYFGLDVPIAVLAQ